MSKVKSISVTTTFKVVLNDVNIPAWVLDEFKEAFEKGKIFSEHPLVAYTQIQLDALNWLHENININDFCEIKYVINEIE